MIGVKFHRWTVLSWAPTRKCQKYVNCRCECGTEREVNVSSLKKGGTQSCGCLKCERTSEARTTHGATANGARRPLYAAWLNMRNRCYNSNVGSFKDYGARGIAVCEEWSAFEPFQEWALEAGWVVGLQIDRKDNDGPYSPDNCRIVTRIENARNKRSNRLITWKGETLPMSAWAERVGLTYSTVQHRMDRGWPLDRVFGPALRKRQGIR